MRQALRRRSFLCSKPPKFFDSIFNQNTMRPSAFKRPLKILNMSMAKRCLVWPSMHSPTSGPSKSTHTKHIVGCWCRVAGLYNLLRARWPWIQDCINEDGRHMVLNFYLTGRTYWAVQAVLPPLQPRCLFQRCRSMMRELGGTAAMIPI